MWFPISAKREAKSPVHGSSHKSNLNNNCSLGRQLHPIVGLVLVYAKLFLGYVKARSNVYIFPVASLISLLIGSHGNPDPLIALLAATSCYLCALATYVYNDITDVQVDKINRTNRPSITRSNIKGELVKLVTILYACSLALAVFINIPAFLIVTTCTIMGIIYSHPKLNLKEKFPFKTVLTAMGAGLSSLYGGVAIQAGIFSLPVIYASLSFFAFFFILGPLGDIGDLRGDRVVGRRTFPIVIGMAPTLAMMFSVPAAIIASITILYCLYSGSINMVGFMTVIATCFTTLALLFIICKKLDQVSQIRSTRHRMRILHVSLQLSLLLSFL
ncbi:putative digeranylgeranylglyceryl phosphate synthase [Candidatus Nitrososphaera gargensis Ga9.2]|uniref:Putative digeranylgeranylglyceryl phosphate synthase n=1 Tax=Nitrososphaera gargensis (strain Ga9.2) TaxID=1237085 RepID=K0IM15_NITGG|nr:putative digeranylgeranylglyceryl phosphate synthase [Candidatus Nitrososphaera gargensis Ga9.2]